MRSLFISSVAFLALLSPVMTAAVRAADEQPIKDCLNDFQSAWNKDDTGAMAMVFVEDATLINPFGTLWFIYLLAVFFLVAKLLRPVPPALVWITAALLEAAPIATGNMLIDEFSSRFVYFYTGYLLGPLILATVDALSRRRVGGVL